MGRMIIGIHRGILAERGLRSYDKIFLACGTLGFRAAVKVSGSRVRVLMLVV